MNKTLLPLFLFLLSVSTQKANAQDFDLTVFENAIFYGMYEATVSEPVPTGAIRHTNSSYARMLSEEELASFGNTLTMTVRLNPLCDNYDRIGNVNLALVPKGSTSYTYNQVTRIEIGRFITPFMHLQNQPDEVPYVYQVDNLTAIFHDETITSTYDLWIEFEVYGYQGGPGQGGAAVEIPICAGRNDVYQGTLEFSSTDTGTIPDGYNYLLPMSHKLELKNYDLSGTDIIGETTKTLNFSLPADVQNAKLYFINSNHGSNANGEEYVRRWHYLSMDGTNVLTYKPGGLSCVPFFDYNTQPNCIYLQCNLAGNPPRPDTAAAWSWNNWCPGDKIPIRVVELGTLAAGDHAFNINVPDAVFSGAQGYFPMSVYLQGETSSLSVGEFAASGFTVSPNPVVDVAEIKTNDSVTSVNVYNTLGQLVWRGHNKAINMVTLQKGLYIVEIVFNNDRTETIKVIKE
ncbi:MAG TPA: peptide-N-glycosidase F-related protein [Flavobacterium sp.]